jgi:hypothetical protein
VIYGFLVEFLLIWALLPNLKRLRDGTERRHGLPVKLEQLKRHRDEKRGGKTS